MKNEKTVIRGVDCSDLEAEAKAYVGFRYWTKADVAILTEYFQRVHIDVLVKKLDRTKGSIIYKANMLGLRRTAPPAGCKKGI